MITPARTLWQPGVDAPLFPAELLNGPGSLGGLDSDLRVQVLDYLAAVVFARGPLHVNVAWNALHYGWDLAAGGYTETLLNLDQLPRLDTQQLERFPTGVIATLPTETPVWVEVVHVEADDLAGDDDGDLPARRSGAPHDDRIRLRTVIDPGVFGPPLSDQQRVLDRLSRRGTLDGHGHLVATSLPQNPELAEEVAGDPMGAYASWLAADDNRLGGGPVPAALETNDPEVTSRAVTASLHALRTLAADDDRLLVIGEHLTAAGAPRILGTDDVDDIVRHVLRVRRRQHRYTAAGVAMRHLGSDRPVHRTRYVAALTQLTAALNDAGLTGGSDSSQTRLRLDDPGRGGGVWRAVGAGEDDPGDGCDPLVALGLGYAGSLAPVQLQSSDDTSSQPAAPDATDPATPPAIGNETPGAWAEPLTPPASDRVETDPSDTGDGLLGDLAVSASHLTYTVAVRTRHLTDGTLPTPVTLHETQLLHAPQPLAVRLGHAGNDLHDDETFHQPVTAHDDPHQLRGVTWPLVFYPGILLTATWTVGGRILDLTSELLPDPVSFAGVLLTHATDLTILATHLGQSPPDSATAAAAAGNHAQDTADGNALDGDAPDAPGTGNPDAPAEEECGIGGPVTTTAYGDQDLADAGNRAYLALLLRTVARTIDPGADGVRSFTAPVLVATAFAGLPQPKDAVGRAHRLLDAHAARGRLLRLVGDKTMVSVTAGFREGPPTYLWWPPGGIAPTHRLPILPGLAVLRPHRVPVSLRRLPDGWEPSPDKVASWPQVRASLGPTYLPAQLPPGVTWVEAHERGSDPGWQSGAVRQR